MSLIFSSPSLVPVFRPTRRVWRFWGSSLILLWPLLLLSLALSACASDAGDSEPWVGAKHEVILGLNDGIIFSTGEITQGGAIKGSDLVVFAHQAEDIDLKSGVDPAGTAHRQMKVFRTSSLPTSPNFVFDNLEAVPSSLPDSMIMDDYLRRAAHGNGLVVENNMSPGYTKVFVDLYNKPGRNVRIHYIAVSTK